MLTKKGQLSIETMILYGLIALVALSTVAALIYFHVLDLGRYLPDTCNIGGTGDLKCEEMRVSSTSNTIELGIRNVAQKNIANVSITLTEPDNIHLKTKAIGYYDGSIPPGQIVMIQMNVTQGGFNYVNPATGVSMMINQGKILKDQLFEAQMYSSYKYSNGAITQEATGNMKVKTS